MLQFKQEAVRLVVNGQSIAAVTRTLGLVNQALFNWVRARRQGKLKGVAKENSRASTASPQVPGRWRAAGYAQDWDGREDGARHPEKSDSVLCKKADLK